MSNCLSQIWCRLAFNSIKIPEYQRLKFVYHFELLTGCLKWFKIRNHHYYTKVFSFWSPWRASLAQICCYLAQYMTRKFLCKPIIYNNDVQKLFASFQRKDQLKTYQKTSKPGNRFFRGNLLSWAHVTYHFSLIILFRKFTPPPHPTSSHTYSLHPFWL